MYKGQDLDSNSEPDLDVLEKSSSGYAQKSSESVTQCRLTIDILQYMDKLKRAFTCSSMCTLCS
jgi:hypothetical protein